MIKARGRLAGFVRLSKWITIVALAAVGGAIWRILRKLVRRPPRIWHGFWPIKCLIAQVQADRHAGYPSRSVVHYSTRLPYEMMTRKDFDVIWQEREKPPTEYHWYCLADLLLHGDIWRAYFDCLFYPTNRRNSNESVFALLRVVGIKVIVHPQGGDVAYLPSHPTRFKWVERYQRDYPRWDLVAQREVVQERVRLFSRHASFVCADTGTKPFIERCDLTFRYLAVEASSIADHFSTELHQPNPVPLIVHATNHHFVKGTDVLLESLERIRSDGLRYDLDIVEGVPRKEALARYARADIIADQFCMGTYGVFALEGMSLGKPVLTYLDEEHLEHPVQSLPLVNTNPDNLYSVLSILIRVPALRERLGEACAIAARKYHSVEALAEVWDRIYRHVWRKQPLDLTTTTKFASDRHPRSSTENPRDPEFWPVPVDDLWPEILDAFR